MEIILIVVGIWIAYMVWKTWNEWYDTPDRSRVRDRNARQHLKAIDRLNEPSRRAGRERRRQRHREHLEEIQRKANARSAKRDEETD